MVETIVFERIRDVFCICETYSVYARRILDRYIQAWCSVSTLPLRGAFFSEKQRPFLAWKERPAHLPARAPNIPPTAHLRGRYMYTYSPTLGLRINYLFNIFFSKFI